LLDYEARSLAELYARLAELSAERQRIREEQLIINTVISQRIHEAGQAGPPPSATVVHANVAKGFSHGE